jgi:hypothetical protein
MNIKISDKWFITCDRLQYILNEIIPNDPDNPRTKSESRIVQTYYTNLGTLLAHIMEYEPRTKDTNTIKELLIAIKDVEKTAQKSVEILKKNKVSYLVNQE